MLRVRRQTHHDRSAFARAAQDSGHRKGLIPTRAYSCQPKQPAWDEELCVNGDHEHFDALRRFFFKSASKFFG